MADEVFLSRTSDMAEYPAGGSFVDAAVDAVIQAGRTPVDMRYFAARDEDPASYCRQRVREADVYVAVVGRRYGSVVPGEDVSYTALEFREATAAGKLRLVFLLDEGTPVPRKLVDDGPARIDEFRARLQRSGLITATFATPDGLRHEVYKALSALPTDGGTPAADRHGRPGRPSKLTPASEMADEIAVAVRREWEAEVQLRRVNDPYTIPVRWEPAEESLVAGWAAVERAACSAGWPEQDRSRWAPGPAALAGGDIAGTVGRVPTGRLVVLGEPGAGKTILAVRLVLDLLARRNAGDPVPVLVWPDEPAAGLPDPGALLGAGLDTRAAVERHLLGGFVPAAYRPHPDPARRYPWEPVKARRWLVFLAGHLEQRGTTDLAWWELHTAVPRLLPGLVFGFPFGLSIGLAFGLTVGLGLGLGLAAGLTFGLVFGVAGGTRQPAPGLRWSLNWAGIAVGFGGGFVFGLPGGLAFGLAFGLVVGLDQVAWGRFAVARCWLALRGQLPWRLMRFLVDAHEQRGALRQAGAVYQFRHAELQGHLVERQLAPPDRPFAVR